MPEYRNPCEKLKGTSWSLCLFYIFPVFEKGMMPVKEHRGVTAVTGVGISKGWGLGICRVIFDLGPGAREHPNRDIMSFRALLSQSEQRKYQSCSYADCSEGGSVTAIAVLEVLVKVVGASREPKGSMANTADWVEKQPHREGADGEEATNCTECCWSANYK